MKKKKKGGKESRIKEVCICHPCRNVTGSLSLDLTLFSLSYTKKEAKRLLVHGA